MIWNKKIHKIFFVEELLQRMLNTENYNGQKIGKVNSSILPNFYSCRNRGNYTTMRRRKPWYKSKSKLNQDSGCHQKFKVTDLVTQYSSQDAKLGRRGKFLKHKIVSDWYSWVFITIYFFKVLEGKIDWHIHIILRVK